MKILFAVCLLCVLSISSAINVTQCHDIASPIDGLTERVKVGNCKKPPCRLRKNTEVLVEIKVKAEEDVETLTNSIQSFIVGVPFPFPGYDGTDACKNMYALDGKTKVGCPLKAGQEYLYKNAIEVLQIYPRVKTVVHWGLTKADGKDLTCFEVPARITN